MQLSENTLSDPKSKILAVLRQFSSIPSKLSQCYEELEVSAQQLIAEYKHSPDQLCNQIKIALTSIYKRIFPDHIIDIECLPEYNKEDTGFDIIIDVKISKDEFSKPYEYIEIMEITPDGYLTFKRNKGAQ